MAWRWLGRPAGNKYHYVGFIAFVRLQSRPELQGLTLIHRARKHSQHGAPSAQRSVTDTNSASTSQQLESFQEMHAAIPSVAISGPDSPVPQHLALHPSASLETYSAVSDRPSTSLSDHSGPVHTLRPPLSPSLNSVDRTVSSVSPHSAPLSLLCEATALAECLPVTSEPSSCPNSRLKASEEEHDITMENVGPSPVNAPRSRASSISSGMSYDEAKDVSGEQHTALSWIIVPTCPLV